MSESFCFSFVLSLSRLLYLCDKHTALDYIFIQCVIIYVHDANDDGEYDEWNFRMKKRTCKAG